ncbi:MAG: hypothetical protein D6741_13810, partial [Planctomycetota bacterium]
AELSGKIGVARFDGKHVPLVDETAAAVVVDRPFEVSRNELMRVLAPGGLLCTRNGDAWTTERKPWPDDVDQWTHFLHDASNNQVSDDKRVGPPKGLRWVSGPRWCRSHEWPTSVQCTVTAGGRVFTIIDLGPIGVYRHLPQDCRLVARDAFSGVHLWEVPLIDWQPEFGTGTENRWQMHHTIARRLVTDGKRVYVTLRFLNSPVSVLDAATGEVLVEALPGTRGADEILLSDGVLVAKCTQGRSIGALEKIVGPALATDERLVGVDIESGRKLWETPSLHVLPYALAIDAGRVVYHDGTALTCLDLRSGKPRWKVECPILAALGGSTSLAVHGGVVLLHVRGRLALPESAVPADDSAKDVPAKGKKPATSSMTAFALEDGDVLWQRRGHTSLAGASHMPTEIFVIGDTLFYGQSTEGYDLHTGEVKTSIDVGNLISPGHHYRCYRGKATCDYLIWPKRGAEFIDVVEGKNHMRNDWLRAPCFTSFVPANGLFYVPPSQCFCYPGVIVPGYLAFTSKAVREKTTELPALETTGATITEAASPSAADWPMYRHDNARSGHTSAKLGPNLSPAWDVRLASATAQPIGVNDRLWLAEKDAGQIRCLEAATGKTVWTFLAGGRIDSPPTYWKGRLLFGCRDGYVYCLDATNGALVWRFRAAPDDRRLVAEEQVESLWPVSGSVLVQDGKVYVAAGRSSFLDGGIYVYALDAEDGHPSAKEKLEGPWPDIWKDVGTPFAMEGARPDLFVSDGRNLYMGRIKFDPDLNRIPLEPASSLGELDMGETHLVATGGFLDDSGFDRIYWMHSRWWPGFYLSQHAPKAGQIIVFDEHTTYAVKYFYRRILWATAFFPGEHGYLLYADDASTEPALLEHNDKGTGLAWLPPESYTDQYRHGGRGVEKGTGWVRLQPAKWQKFIP